MRVYLAARFSQNEEMRKVRSTLESYGHRVTSRWIDLHPGVVGAQQSINGFSSEQLASEPDRYAVFALADIGDLIASDTVISFTDVDGGGRGGRHVEFGLALGLGKQLILCGPRQHVFHTLPQVKHYDSFDDLLSNVDGLLD